MDSSEQSAKVQRIGAVIGVAPESVEEYVRLHREVWPDVLAALRAAHVTNYSIFLHDGLLFSYLEYRGDDLASDLARVAADPTTQRWWAVTMPLQRTMRSAPDQDWWTSMQEVFHLD